MRKRIAIACLLVVAGCASHRPVAAPYREAVSRPAKWVAKNLESMNGPSLTGYAKTKHSVSLCTRKDADGVPKLSVKHHGTKRIKIGLVPIHEPETWDEFNRFQQQHAVVGIGIEIRF